MFIQRFSYSRRLQAIALAAILIISTVAVLLFQQPVMAVGGQQRIAYYGSWDIYSNEYYIKNLVASGAAANLTTLIYSFENIHPTNLECFADVHSVNNDESDPNAGDGASDAWADYQKPFTSDISVDGTADSSTQALRGNFNQLKQLKQKYPNLKILISIGGWTFSKYFSDAAATSTSRQNFVNSCIDMYIRGNLPTNVAGDTTAGGAGVAAGIFDGIDIDWEFPGSTNGHVGNHHSSNDTANYTALLAEFRSQLNTQGALDGGKHYLLTAAVSSGASDIALIQANSIKSYLDWAGVMTYDMHGAWENHTNFQAPLYPSSSDPDASMALTVDQAINRWKTAGWPANKLVVGLPFYWRGWSGVTAGSNNGLYQPATGPSAAFSLSAQAGTAHYKELVAAGLIKTAHLDSTTKSPWIYSSGNFYTGETPQSIIQKGRYIRDDGLLGAMIYSLEGDDSAGSLLKATVFGLNGGSPLALPDASLVLSASRTSTSSTNTATNAEPINMIGGNYLATRHEIVIPDKDITTDFALSYNSALASQNSTVGWGWTHSYNISAIADSSGNVGIRQGDGRIDLYTLNGAGGYNSPQGIFDTLTFSSGQFTLTRKDKSQFIFNSDGLLISLISANGTTQTFTYNSNNLLQTLTDSPGRQLNFTYTDSNQLSQVADSLGRQIKYTYNPLGDLIKVENQAGEITSYDYDADHRLIKVTDPRGNDVVVNTYNTDGKVIEQKDALNNTITLAYTSGQTTFTDARGNDTIYRYDSNWRITQVEDALGSTITTTYDSAGNKSQVTDQLGHSTSYSYDSRGNVIQTTNAISGTATMTYDGSDNLLTYTDQNNHTTTYVYDSHGNITKKTNPLNKDTNFAYDTKGQLISVTDALNNLTGFVYDAKGNIVTKTDPSNRNTYYAYDNLGRLTISETHNHHQTLTAVDSMDRVTKITDPSNHDTLFEYDADGNRTKATDANNHNTRYQYDANNRLTKVTNPLAKDTTYVYDANGNLITKTDAKGNSTAYTYDALNRQITTTDPLGHVTTIAYDNAGNIASRTDASSRTTTYLYDNLNRLKKITYPDATTATYTYDSVGNVLTATNSTGTTTYTYNANNQILTVTDPHSSTITYTYNNIGSLDDITYPDGKVVDYTYTPSNQLSTVTDWNNKTTSYLYDNDAHMAVKNYPNTVSATYTYDSNGNISALTYKKGSSNLTKFSYTRDNVGNITEEEELKSGNYKYHDYTYDAADQLTLDDAPTDTFTYTYDNVGNMATSTNGTSGTSTYTYNQANQLTAKTNTTRTLTYDNQGNQITDTGKTLGYNYDNQLISYTSGSLTTNYIYDAMGNRIDKTQTGSGAVNYRYVNTGNNNVLTAKNLSTSATNYYVYGLDLISQGPAANSNRQYYLTDASGNVRYVTDNSGNTVTNGTLTYDPYGKQISGSTTLTNYAYQSEQKDQESSLIYLRARYYDPTLARFTSKDPFSGALDIPSTQNGYNYANDNPTNLRDASGSMALPTMVIGGIIGGVAGGVANGLAYTIPALSNYKFNMQELGAAMAGGTASGIVGGACLGSGVGVAVSTICGAAGGALGEYTT